MIRILLVDDRLLIRQTLQAILAKNNTMTIVGEADCGSKALEIIARETIDIAIVDLDMPGMNGFELTQKITRDYADIKVIILSSHEDAASINRAIECGARGYLIKDTSIAEIVDTIDRVQRGYFQLGLSLWEKLINRQNNYEVTTNRSISDLKTKSQHDFYFVKQEITKQNQQVKQEVFAELDRELDRLKFELQQGLDDFEVKAVLHLKNSLSNYVENLKNQSSSTWKDNYKEITQSINLVEHNYKISLRKLSREIAILRYCLIFGLVFFVISYFSILSMNN
ncbi:MAG: response regulator transcription factor [Cyanobacteria bacterium P01_A01_bin.83]